ncbi:MAG TPA: AMP-binding protein [Streptosporangiaceae bacterium]|nr:AMP-binding protein [Streptosporangiaceae bacterium]
MADAEGDAVGFWQLAAQDPDRVAVIGSSGDTTRRGVLLSLVNRLSHGLRRHGLAAGDAVAVLLPNRLEYIALALATEQTGIRLVPLNSHLTAAEIGYVLADSGAAALVTDPAYAEQAGQAADQAGIPPEGRFATAAFGTFAPLADLIEGSSEALPDDRRAGQFMPYTSGTTGKPKGVCKPLFPVPPEAIIGFVGGELRKRFGFTVDEGVHLVTSPLYYTAPFGFALQLLHMGHTVVLMDRFDAAGSLRAIEQHRVSSTFIVPTMLHRWLALSDAERTQAGMSSLRQVIHGGAPCPVATKHRALAWLGPIVIELYSSSEGGFVTVTPDEWLARPGTVGRATPDAVTVIDEAGQPCGPGETGLIYFRNSPVLPFEYHGDPAKTAAAIHGDYFTVGDLGHVDADGWLYVDDRRTDLIISGGVNLYPAEIEEVFLAHPAVADAAVIGVSDQEWGQRAVALVEPWPGVEPDDVLAKELDSFARAQLAPFKVPRSIEFRSSLPRTPSGKLSRARLREQYAGTPGAVGLG